MSGIAIGGILFACLMVLLVIRVPIVSKKRGEITRSTASRSWPRCGVNVAVLTGSVHVPPPNRFSLESAVARTPGIVASRSSTRS